MTALIDEIREHEKQGVLSSECCPEPNYWHWHVYQPGKLSSRLASIYIVYGEIRWYGGYDN